MALGEVHGDGVAGMFPECGEEGLGDGEFVGAVAEGHERSGEGLVVDRSADFDEAGVPK